MSGGSDSGCYVCGRTDSRRIWMSKDFPGKKFCTKSCFNKFSKNPEIKHSSSTSKTKDLIKKRIYPSVFDIIGLKYMLRTKCSWCKSGHDARSKYEISHTNYPGKIFYSMDCYRNYNSYYKSNPKDKHEINRKSSLFGVSHHRLIGGGSTVSKYEEENKVHQPNCDSISQYSKDSIIKLLIGKEFVINDKICTMAYGSGSAQTIWVIKKGIWGEHVIQANKLKKEELIKLYKQAYDSNK
tara:strand:- start:59 stop:775 length:717 start_codon:yes stop_codon:yes gene_type:complete